MISSKERELGTDDENILPKDCKLLVNDCTGDERADLVDVGDIVVIS